MDVFGAPAWLYSYTVSLDLLSGADAPLTGYAISYLCKQKTGHLECVHCLRQPQRLLYNTWQATMVWIVRYISSNLAKPNYIFSSENIGINLFNIL